MSNRGYIRRKWDVWKLPAFLGGSVAYTLVLLGAGASKTARIEELVAVKSIIYSVPKELRASGTPDFVVGWSSSMMDGVWTAFLFGLKNGNWISVKWGRFLFMVFLLAVGGIYLKGIYSSYRRGDLSS